MIHRMVLLSGMLLFSTGFSAWRDDIQEEAAVKETVAASDTALVQKDTADSSGEYEVFDYSPDNDNYQLITKPAPQKQIFEPLPEQSDEESYPGVTSEDLYTPPAPTRPIGKTVAGIILTINGGISTVLGIIAIANQPSNDYNDEYDTYNSGPPSFIYVLPGLGMFLPGIAFLAAASSDWQRYNEWERNYKNQSAGPGFGVQYTFTF